MGYSTLKAALDAVVKTNGRQQITGSNLNGVMTTILQGVDVMDRANPADTSGMNHVVLKKNLTFAEQVTGTNTIYEIRDAFDLGGGSVSIPTGCILYFNGGKLSDGTIVGNATGIVAEKEVIFDSDIVIDGTWKNSVVFSEWCPLVSGNVASDNRQMLRNIFALCKSDNTTSLFLQNGVFYLNAYKDNDNTGISVFSNTYVFARGAELRVIPNNKERYALISIVSESNIIFDGGTFTGDVDSHTGSTGEFGHGFSMANAKNITLKDLIVQKCWGDGIYITNPYSYVEQEVTGGQCENIVIQRCKSLTNRRQGCSIEAAIGVLIEDCEFAYTGTISGTAPMLGVDVEPYAEHQVVKDITIRNCHIYGNSNTYYGISLSHGTASEYLEDNFSIDSCVIDKGVQCKPLNGFSIKNTKMGDLLSNSQTIGARVSEKLVFDIFGSELGQIDFKNIESQGKISDTRVDPGNRVFALIEGASSVANIKFYNCSIKTGGNNQTPYIESTLDLSNVGLHFYNCEISGQILNTAQVGFRIAGDFVGNVFDVSTTGNDTAYISLSAPGEKVRIKGNTFLNVGTQKRLVHFIQTNDLSSFNPLYEIEGNRFVGGSTSEKRIFFNYGGTPVKHVKSVGNFYPASAGYEAQSQVDISFTNDIFEVGGAFLLRNGSNFTNLDGTNTKKVGTTTERPSATSVGAGFSYFDTTLGKMIVSNGTVWVNMDGTALA